MENSLEEDLIAFTQAHQKQAFGFIHYLSGGEIKDTAERASLCLVNVFFQQKARYPLEQESLAILKFAIVICKGSDNGQKASFDFISRDVEHREQLLLIGRALRMLAFDYRACILLRDQLHLPLETISSIMNLNLHDIKLKLNVGRIELRQKIADLLAFSKENE